MHKHPSIFDTRPSHSSNNNFPFPYIKYLNEIRSETYDVIYLISTYKHSQATDKAVAMFSAW